MAKYEILDETGNVIDSIIANESFMKQNHQNYRQVEELILKEVESHREWRNQELNDTDKFMMVSDYPYKDQLAAYRQALRDWPSTEDFPDTRPTLNI